MIDLCASPVPVGLTVLFPVEPPIPLVSLMPLKHLIQVKVVMESIKKTVVIQDQSELKCSPRN